MTALYSRFLNFKTDLDDLIDLPDFSILTWLFFGASLQLFSQLLLPSGMTWLPPLLYFVYIASRSAIQSRGIFTTAFTTVRQGIWTAKLPEESDGIVMFILGARINHPLGKLAPGIKEIGESFEDMWKEAEKNREKWGYLGRSETLYDISDKEGITEFWLSYWKDVKSLANFATSPVHTAGRVDYHKKKFPHMGILHETYHSPKGHWETIYHNCPPLGLGRVPVFAGQPGAVEFGDTLKKNSLGSTMASRMTGK